MKTRVILRQDIPALGNTGDIIEVAAGYARNQLVPSGMAYMATADAELRVEKDRKTAEVLRAQQEAEFTALTQRIGDVQLTFEEKVNLEGQLYGSVNASRIVTMLSEQGLNIEERQVRLGEPIRKAGDYTVKIHVHGEMEASIQVWVIGVMPEGTEDAAREAGLLEEEDPAADAAAPMAPEAPVVDTEEA